MELRVGQKFARTRAQSFATFPIPVGMTSHTMTAILLKNTDVLTLDNRDEVIRQVDIGIDRGRIAFIGTAPEGWQADETLDLTDHLVMPGFWNAHTHAAIHLSVH